MPKQAKRTDLIGKFLTIDGEQYRIGNVGFVSEGKIFLHLSSQSRFRWQTNGKVPAMIADWFPLEEIEALI